QAAAVRGGWTHGPEARPRVPPGSAEDREGNRLGKADGGSRTPRRAAGALSRALAVIPGPHDAVVKGAVRAANGRVSCLGAPNSATPIPLFHKLGPKVSCQEVAT